MASPPAGWYPDPAGSGNARYWDGQRWTGQLRSRRGRASGATSGAELNLDQLLTPFLRQLGQRSHAAGGPRVRTEPARGSTHHDPVTTHSTLVTHDTSSQHSPRISAAAPRTWGRVWWWLVVMVVVLVGLLLLAALLVGGPDADLGETVESMFG